VLPFNAATKRSYNGINIPILWHASSQNAWPTMGFMTYRQAQAIGAQVKGGEKGTTVVFTSKLTVGEGDDQKQVGYLKAFSVFNVAQIDGLRVEPVKEEPLLPGAKTKTYDFTTAMGADIRHGGEQSITNSRLLARILRAT
jgi:antirestriction protein ArdC